MAKNSKIEWTDHTFNPWHGCVKISEGCQNCYAEARQFGGDWWGKDKPRRFFGEKHWNQPIKWNAEAEKLGIRYKVFCGSYCDVFEKREDLKEPRERLGELIEDTPYLDWLLLTKRPENVYVLLGELNWVVPLPYAEHPTGELEYDLNPYIPGNVWLGVSVENQKQANIRIPELLKTPAKVLFLSCEPLLESIDLTKLIKVGNYVAGGGASDLPLTCGQETDDIQWVICGGESGPNARPMNPSWARFLLKQCKQINVPFFMKQMGTHWAKQVPKIISEATQGVLSYPVKDIKGTNPEYWPQDLNIRQFPEVT